MLKFWLIITNTLLTLARSQWVTWLTWATILESLLKTRCFIFYAIFLKGVTDKMEKVNNRILYKPFFTSKVIHWTVQNFILKFCTNFYTTMKWISKWLHRQISCFLKREFSLLWKTKLLYVNIQSQKHLKFLENCQFRLLFQKMHIFKTQTYETKYEYLWNPRTLQLCYISLTYIMSWLVEFLRS